MRQEALTGDFDFGQFGHWLVTPGKAQ
jgi:hypothetical protein